MFNSKNNINSNDSEGQQRLTLISGLVIILISISYLIKLYIFLTYIVVILNFLFIKVNLLINSIKILKK